MLIACLPVRSPMAFMAKRDSIVHVESLVGMFGPTQNVMGVQTLRATTLLAPAMVPPLNSARPSNGSQNIGRAIASSLPVHISRSGDLWVSSQRLRKRGSMLSRFGNADFSAGDFCAMGCREFSSTPIVTVAEPERPSAKDAVACACSGCDLRRLAAATHADSGLVFEIFRRTSICASVVAGDVFRRVVAVMGAAWNYFAASTLTKHAQVYHA